MGIKLYLTLGEEHRLRMVENRALRKLNGPERDGVREKKRNCIMCCFMIFTTQQFR
jgi:hypothetical protein